MVTIAAALLAVAAGPLPGLLPVKGAVGLSGSPRSMAWSQLHAQETRDTTTRRDASSDTATARQQRRSGDLDDLSIMLGARMESRAQLLRNDRCTTSQLSIPGNTCRSAPILPEFDFQFNVRSAGTVADRLHVDVDYDSQRQFDASNSLSIRYEGKPGQKLQLVEVGNVTFQPPPSRFITSGIPSGNYGVQAAGQIGAMHFSSIFAQQKGNISRDNVFTVGEYTRQQVDRVVEDIQIEPRRFFFTIDPRQLQGYPNIDLLDRPALSRLAMALPDSIRPVRIKVYRQLIGAANQNPRGPRLSVRGARNPSRQTYELLRENIDYYLDPSMLWIALVRPLSSTTERLAIAYEVEINGAPGRNVATGGTPDIEYTVAEQFANLLWEPELQPSNQAYFLREIKSIYRLGGEDMRRESLQLRVVTGTSGDQERPIDASAGDTYLQVFGLAQSTNSASLDVENRVWPRPNDSNILAGSFGEFGPQQLIPDYFLFFPSVKPFARSGLAGYGGNPANDTLYHYPNEYLYSPQRPQAIYRMMVSYQSTGGFGGSASQTIQLSTVQVRQNSERVVIDGRELKRNVDYHIDYDLGMITFTRPDTLFSRPRDVSVRYEENPLFTTTPTTILGLSSSFQLDNGLVALTAISQHQKSSLNRPPLGLEAAGSFVAGVTSSLQWNASELTKAIANIPFARSKSASSIALQAELAMSKPQPNAAGQAYLDSFEGSADRSVSLLESAWYFGSRPAMGSSLASLGSTVLSNERATTMAWQNNGLNSSGAFSQFTIQQIDPSVRIAGAGVQPVEQLLWLTMYPLRFGGMPTSQTAELSKAYAWTVGNTSMVGVTPTGRRWRSVRTVLNPTGMDLSRTENIEFFALVNADPTKLRRNPTLVLDFGEVSENSITFAPETLTVNAPSRPGLPADTTYRGKRLVGFDRLDTERDPISRAFNAAENDKGLAGDIADTIVVVDRSAGLPQVSTQYGVRLCSQSVQRVQWLGDNRANCTAGNNRLDEEDIDLDGQLNIPSASIEQEQLRRFMVDLSDRNTWSRVGKCFVQRDSSGMATSDSLCWVQVRLNWRAPVEELNNPNDRRIRALRLTVISNPDIGDDEFTRIALARFRLVGAPWLKRNSEPLSGMAGDSSGTVGGFVIASVIGTLDSTSAIPYSSPPGVAEVPENRQSGYENTRVQINEQALRIQTGIPGRQFRVFDRAEAYMRFPEGTRTFMGYRSLRLWMRGRGNGWGALGELNGFIKIGRDENNFYMYRTPVNSGGTQSSWLPEIHVDLTRFQVLRARLENMYLQPGADSLQCTGVDLELIKRSGGPPEGTARRRAVCEDGYIVYTADPAVTPPNLAGVQELAVGIVRVDSIAHAGTGIMNGDTLELWVNDIRLSDVVDDIGFAGEVGLTMNAGDLGDFRMNLSRRDPNFRQLNETPNFLASSIVNLGTTLHLERFLPEKFGISLPFSADYSGTGVDQLFLNRTDVRANGIAGLRDPGDRRTTYSVAMRRISRIESGWYAPLVNGLTLNGTWSNGSSQSTYQELANSSYTLGAGILLSDETRDSRMPSIVSRILEMLPDRLISPTAAASVGDQRIRWRPAEFRINSSLVRNSTSVTSFGRAAASELDTGRTTRILRHAWQNVAALSFRPTPGLTADFTARQLLDLRDYRASEPTDSSGRGDAAFRERSQFMGLDLGLERERSFTSSIRVQPTIAGWLLPRAGFTSSFTFNRDPNARTLLIPGDSSTSMRLPQRMGALNAIDVGATIDPGRLLPSDGNGSSWFKWLSASLAPFDIQWQQNLSSNYDNSPIGRGPGYQLGLGGIGSFRGLDGRLASTAGRMRRASATGAINLPLSLRLQAHAENGSTETWIERAGSQGQALITSDQRVYPDISLRWNWSPQKLGRIISQLSLDGGWTTTRQETAMPAGSDGAVDRSVITARRRPLSASITWSILGDLITSARASSESREDMRPGARLSGTTDRRSIFLARSFPLPASWNTRSGRMRASASYDTENNTSIITSVTGGDGSGIAQYSTPMVLTNNGRRAFSVNANTELSELLTFTLAGSHVVSFDRAYNRQTTNVIFSAVLQLRFFSGDMH